MLATAHLLIRLFAFPCIAFTHTINGPLCSFRFTSQSKSACSHCSLPPPFVFPILFLPAPLASITPLPKHSLHPNALNSTAVLRVPPEALPPSLSSLATSPFPPTRMQTQTRAPKSHLDVLSGAQGSADSPQSVRSREAHARRGTEAGDVDGHRLLLEQERERERERTPEIKLEESAEFAVAGQPGVNYRTPTPSAKAKPSGSTTSAFWMLPDAESMAVASGSTPSSPDNDWTSPQTDRSTSTVPA